MSVYKASLPNRPGVVTTNEGGTAFSISDWTRLQRFMFLGTEGGTFYVNESEMTKDAINLVERCIAEDPARALGIAFDAIESGRAYRKQPALVTLAMACVPDDQFIRRSAYLMIPLMISTGSDMLTFVSYVNGMRGWSKGLIRAITRWYEARSVDVLAYQLVKYRNRDGFTHRDVARLTHLKSNDPARNALYGWLYGKEDDEALPDIIKATIWLRDNADASSEDIAEHIVRNKLPRECVPSELLNRPKVWDALLADMPMTAMVRNLGKMGSVNLLVQGSEASATVASRLSDGAYIKRAKVHPMGVMLAGMTYSSGHGFRGSNTWPVVPAVIDGLDSAFYASFANVEPTGKKLLVALDCSASMTSGMIMNTNISAAQAQAVMAMTAMRTEPYLHIMGFHTEIANIKISARQRFDDVMRGMEIAGRGTYTSIPLEYALKEKLDLDAIILYTDSISADRTTNSLLGELRKKNPDLKAICVAMTANDVSVFNPEDSRNLNVAGMDGSLPLLINQFIME